MATSPNWTSQSDESLRPRYLNTFSYPGPQSPRENGRQNVSRAGGSPSLRGQGALSCALLFVGAASSAIVEPPKTKGMGLRLIKMDPHLFPSAVLDSFVRSIVWTDPEVTIEYTLSVQPTTVELGQPNVDHLVNGGGPSVTIWRAFTDTFSLTA